MLNAVRVVPYTRVPNHAVFHVVSPDKEVTRSGKVISNEGTFIKVGNSHAINLKNHKVCIFNLNKTMCHMIREHNDLLSKAALKACGELR